MPLPSADAARSLEWPPPQVARYTRQQREWAAWWSGDCDQLRRYSQPRRYWARVAEAERTTPGRSQSRTMHTGLAADIVTTSADLLFGDPLDLTIPPPVATGEEGEQTDTQTTDGLTEGDASVTQEQAAVEVTQARLDELRDDLGLDNMLLVAGEVAAALGGAWLRPAWDDSIADHPLLSVIDPDQAVPEYRMGHLTAVTFWEVVDDTEEGVTWRHLERHEVDPSSGRGVILHGLYRGDKEVLGKPYDLTAKVATASLDELVLVPEGGPKLLPAYMPNVLPNRKFRRLPVGRSDFDGVEDELDSLDETWASLMRDIRLGKARLMVPEGTLERVAPGPGSGKTFDVDRELMVETDAAADETGGKVAMMQSEIRDTSLLAVIGALVERIVSTAGYSPQTFGLHIEGSAESGTALNVRERKTSRTRGRKIGYARRAIEHAVWALLAIDAEQFGQQIVPMRPKASFPDVNRDAQTTATWVQLLRAAQAMSIETAVREVHPEWDDTLIDAEVARIMDETSMTNPDTLGADASADEPIVDPLLDEPAA